MREREGLGFPRINNEKKMATTHNTVLPFVSFAILYFLFGEVPVEII